MLKTRGRKILRDIMARKGRTALVAISIMIGVFGAVTLISTNDLILSQIKKDIRSDEIAMARLYVTVPTAGTEVDNETYLETLSELPGVTQVEGQAVAGIFWKKPSDERYSEANILAYSEPFGEITLEGIRRVEGEWPEAGQQQVAVEKRFADENGVQLGDTINLRVIGGNAGETETSSEDWTISAIVFHPYWVESMNGVVEANFRIYANYDDAQHIAGFSGFSSFYLRYVDTETAADQEETLKRAVAEGTNYIPLGVWLDDPDDYFLLDEVAQVTNVLNMLAAVALVVSGFLVTNVINTILVEQKQQIGVLKSVGATRWDTLYIYGGVALIYGVIGTIPGVILGVLVGSVMASEVGYLASTLIEGFNVSQTGVLIGIVMGLLVPVVAAAIPVFNGTRVSILDALTDYGISANWGKGLIARMINALPVPIIVRQAFSNVAQKKGRLALTVITLTLAAAAFMGVFAMFSVVNNEIDKLFDTYNFEIAVSPSEAQDFDTVRNLILQVDNVEDVYAGLNFGVQVIDLDGTVLEIGPDSGDSLSTIGLDPSAPAFKITYDDGIGWSEDSLRDGIVLTSKVAKNLDKHVGDIIVISAGGRTGEYEIIGLSDFPFELAFMKWQDLGRLAGFITDDNGTPDDYTDDTPIPTTFFVTLADKTLTGAEVEDYVDLISEQIIIGGITAEYSNEVKVQEDSAEQMMVFNMIFQITSGVMAAVGAIGLLTTLSMAVFERQKEIGVMRSIGAGSSTIIVQFLVEGIFIGVLAWLIAIPLSYLLASALFSALEFDTVITFSYPIWVLGLGLVGMIVIATVASLWPSISAARRTVSDILRYQ